MDYSEFDVWVFKKDEQMRWVWQRLTADGDLRLAARSPFDKLEDCLDDARRCGYTGSFTPPESTGDRAHAAP